MSHKAKRKAEVAEQFAAIDALRSHLEEEGRRQKYENARDRLASFFRLLREAPTERTPGGSTIWKPLLEIARLHEQLLLLCLAGDPITSRLLAEELAAWEKRLGGSCTTPNQLLFFAEIKLRWLHAQVAASLAEKYRASLESRFWRQCSLEAHAELNHTLHATGSALPTVEFSRPMPR
jgi:hypothetical protein